MSEQTEPDDVAAREAAWLADPWNGAAVKQMKAYEHYKAASEEMNLLGLDLYQLRRASEEKLQALESTIAELRGEIERRHTLFDAIAHGDSQHKAWLQAAIEAHFTGQPMPEVVLSERDARMAALEAELTAIKAERDEAVALADWWGTTAAEFPDDTSISRAEEVALWLDYLDNLRETNPQAFDSGEIDREMQRDIRDWLVRYESLKQKEGM